ncbi:uncharacterized protein LOC111046378 isoform X1 [Nilaparvata lugens]|uniref:uncharacterized protein LOC111046378 isoform X1 n=1 Tax=Nilaparvata lugens TaxID=108931 RepID=UPI000B996329|nr:uncharacterized protein LOC111046378 isoform X1 [Nilaparvata lugens]XP_022187596.1 uncharacterized protein LOC111046378 isoform X1 [Nilaparvata lugens]XP_039295005.1 uncharacterized protein LOC111046378 isoform X1 [Nilaparvata lugens]XP_039295012.1 uncharacterized protein LOC111046378 isoform X1 [Nilaparvata lugens]XP_039295018.1 uncharacterized protein LOC111046378 isoform X1 [Nilaparvata lugens]XP_039295027.1 uncharacterized protein LOC111046378 isoform X1 [Nilaparvata lugens]
MNYTVITHEAIMADLTHHDGYVYPPPSGDITCVVNGFADPAKRSLYELRKIAESLRQTYDYPNAQLEIIQQSRGNYHYSAEFSDVEGDENIMPIHPKVQFAENAMRFIIDKSDYNLSDLFHYGLKSLSSVLKYSNLSSLYLRNNHITGEVCDDLIRDLQESQIVTLELPRIDEIINKSYVSINKGSEIFICEYNSSESISRLEHCRNVNRLLTQLLENTHVNSLHIDDEILRLDSFIDTKIVSLSVRECEELTKRLNWLENTLKDSQISSIDLSKCKIDCKSMARIASILVGTSITSLNLSANEIGVVGMNLLVDVLKSTPIHSLDLSGNDLNCDSIIVLASCLEDTKITFLDLRNNQIGNEGLNCLARNLRHTQITSIGLDVNCDGLQIFAPYLMSTNITSLLLNDDNLGNYGLVCLEDVLKNTQVTSIEFTSCNMNCERLQIFSQFLTSGNITSLNLKGSCLGIDGMHCLVNILKSTRISSIDLGDNKLNSESLKIFLSCLVDTKITALSLSGNLLGCEGTKYLISVLKDTRITALDLKNCNLGCNLLMNFVMCLPETEIRSLDLSGNTICCNIFYLASVLSNTEITSLCLSNFKSHDYNPVHLFRNLRRYGTSLRINNKKLCLLSLCYLGRSLGRTKITSLQLRANQIEMDGLKMFSPGLVDSEILELDLSNNKINNCGVYYLSQVLKHTRICSLNLAENEISCEGLKYLAKGLRGSQVVSLNLSYNSIENEGFEYLTKSFVGSRTIEVDLTGNMIQGRSARQICQRAGKQIVLVTMKNRALFCYYNTFKNRNCFIDITIPQISTKRESGDPYEDFKRRCITKLIFLEDYVTNLKNEFQNVNITEIEICGDVDCDDITPVLENNNFAKLKKNWKNLKFKSMSNMKIIALHLQIESYRDLLVGDLKSVLTNSNLVYLDLSDNKLGHWGFANLVEALKDSKIISLDISNNYIEANSVKLLCQVLPQTKITYIDLHSNNIGYYGYTYLMNVVEKTSICWLSLGENNIEEDLEKNIDLSPCIVYRNSTPPELQVRFLFKELVSLNKSSGQFEFVIPCEDSVMSINHYPLLVKHLLDNSNYRVHIYDSFYMRSRNHDMVLLDKINIFVKEISQRFFLFFGNNLIDLTYKFGYDSILDLVKECDNLDLTHFVEFLLLHRVFYYVNNEQSILHPFIYKMLLKHKMPLYNEEMEPNKKHEIISYFRENEIEGNTEIIDLLLSG